MRQTRRLLRMFVLGACLLTCAACARSANPRQAAADSSTDTPTETAKEMESNAMKMNVQIGNSVFCAVLEDNAAVRELIAMMREAPVTIEMNDYAGFEKVGPLGRDLPTDDCQTTAHPGDIVLYNGDNIVMFYGANAWSYTRIGHIEDLTGWTDALGSGPVTAILTLAE